MKTPTVLRCPDGHYRRAIFCLGPYIADYPEQAILCGIVQGWCPRCAIIVLTFHYAPYQCTYRCQAHREDLDGGDTTPRAQQLTSLLGSLYNETILHDEYGIHEDVIVSS